MSASIITEKDCSEIQAAMALALSKLKANTPGLTYEKIGKVIEREKQSVHQYICDTTEMPAACWLKAVAKWPELADRFEYELDEAEKAFRARQRPLDLRQPEHEQQRAA